MSAKKVIKYAKKMKNNLSYETSLTQIGTLLLKFTVWGKRFSPMGKRGLTMGEKLYQGFHDSSLHSI